MADQPDQWARAGEAAREEVRAIFARTSSGGRAPEPERRAPLPGFHTLPLRGWRALSRGGKLALAAAVLAGLCLLAVELPVIVRARREGIALRRHEAAAAHDARVRELVADQRPRRLQFARTQRRRILERGGLGAPAGLGLAGAALEAAIATDARARERAGTLDGRVLRADCRAQGHGTSSRIAGFNCFALTDRRRIGGRDIRTGYRFRARAALGSGLVWCKENPAPLHPTAYVISVPLPRECG